MERERPRLRALPHQPVDQQHYCKRTSRTGQTTASSESGSVPGRLIAHVHAVVAGIEASVHVSSPSRTCTRAFFAGESREAGTYEGTGAQISTPVQSSKRFYLYLARGVMFLLLARYAFAE
jgi:hypothetical protein